MIQYLVSGLFTFWLVMHQRKQAALEAAQLNLIAIQSATQHATDIAQNTQQLTTGVGTLTAEGLMDQNVQNFVVTSLNTPNLAANGWLQVAAFAQGAGCPVLANSIAALGTAKIHDGSINTP